MKTVDISRDELLFLIDQWIVGRHGERNRQIMKRRLIDGICFEPLAEEFEMSVRQTQNIVADCMKILIRHM